MKSGKVMTQLLKRAFYFYFNGFREMTLGRTLWFIILLKLFIMFAILRLLFFPNYLKENAESGEEAEYVVKELIERGEG